MRQMRQYKKGCLVPVSFDLYSNYCFTASAFFSCFFISHPATAITVLPEFFVIEAILLMVDAELTNSFLVRFASESKEVKTPPQDCCGGVGLRDRE